MKQFEIHLAASCSCAGKVGHWVADIYPVGQKWDVQLQGKANCTTNAKLFFKAATAALDDLLEKSEVELHLQAGEALDLILGLVEGDDYRDNDLWQSLAQECDRHIVKIVAATTQCKRHKAAISRLNALIAE